MPQGAFTVERNDNDVMFRFDPAFTGEIPEDQKELKQFIEQTARVLRTIYADPLMKPRLDSALDDLISAALGGVSGATAQPSVARASVEVLRHEILTREAPRIKAMRWRKLGGWALTFILGLIAIDLGTQSALAFAPAWILPSRILTVLGPMPAYCHVLVGSMIGAWASFGIRTSTLTFETLVLSDGDRIPAYLRLTFVAVLATLLALMLSNKFITIQIGETSMARFVDDIGIALLLGAFCGLSEQVVSDRLATQSNSALAPPT